MTSARMVAAARSIHLDGVAAEIAEAWRESGIPSILVRRPSIARHLYLAGESRDHVDADLLVALESVAPAERVLVDHGFRHLNKLEHHPGGSAHSRPDLVSGRGDARIDLHHTIIGADVEPRETWKVMAGHTWSTSSFKGSRFREKRHPPTSTTFLNDLAARDLLESSPKSSS